MMPKQTHEQTEQDIELEKAKLGNIGPISIPGENRRSPRSQAVEDKQLMESLSNSRRR